MSTIGAINLAMNADHSKLSQDLRKGGAAVTNFNLSATRNFNQLNKTVNHVTNVHLKMTEDVKKNNTSLLASMAHVTTIWGGITKAFSMVKGAVSGPLQLAASAEQTKVAFTTLLGSGEAAGKMLVGLNKFAAETPFEFPELADSAKKLVAFGVDADQVIPNLKKLGDVASGLNVNLGDLTMLFGKNKIKDKIQAEQMNQWLERGIPVTEELAKQFGVATTEVEKLVSSGKVRFEHMLKSLTNLTAEGGKFGGMMAAQSQTASGLWSTMMDNINLALTDVGQGIMDAFDLKGVMKNAISNLESLKPVATGMVSWMKTTVDFLKPLFTQGFNVINGVATNFWNVMTGMFSSIGNSISGFLPSWEWMRDSVLFGLIAMEFGFTNFNKMMGLAFNIAKLKTLEWALDFAHLLTDTTPRVVAWFVDNVFTMMRNMGDMVGTVFYNLTNNIVKIWQALPDIMAGSADWSTLWTPLGEGMQREMFKAMPTLPKRLQSEMEKKLLGDIGTTGLEFEAFRQKRMKELFPEPVVANKPAEEKKGPLGPTATPTAKEEGKSPFAGAAIKGTDEFREAIFRNRFAGLQNNKNPMAKTEDLQKKQIAATERVEKAVERQNNKTVSIA